MLQQNNNNNHPCLDMTHRELLHECRRSSVSFTSALEFGAIPLIKGLRAWAVSGGYSKARRKAATAPRAQGTCQQPADPNRAGLRGWSGQVRGGYGQALESTSSAARTPGVRQGGLGALVTVATLKGTEGGGRQTQTRCLFLKAQGRGSYLCAVESRGAGARVAGPRTHAVILEGAKEEARCSSKGTRPSHDGTDDGGMFKVKPRAIRKWRKCSKTTGSAEKRSQGKGETAHPRREPGHKAERNSEMSEPTTQTVSLTSDNAIPDRITPRHIEKNKTKASNASSPSSIKPQSSEDVTEFHEDERALSPRSVYVVVVPESTDPQTSCSSAKLCANTEEQVEACMSISPSNNCSKDDLANKGSYYASDDAQGDTEVINCENDLDANERQNIKTKNKNRNFADVPNLRESFEVSKVQSTSEDLEIKPTITDCNTEPSVVYPPLKTSFEVPVNNIQENQDQEPRTGECLLNCENSEEIDHLKTQRGETPDTQIIVGLEGYIGQSHTSVGVQRNTTEKKCQPPMCSPQHCEELITEYENLEVQQSDKSSSRGFGSPTANVTVNTIHSLPNPAPTTTATMATNIPAPSKGEVGVGGGDSLPLMNLELLSEPERVDNRDKVATDERSLNAGVEEEEDEFGAFMQAGGEQLWKDGFQQLAAGEDYSSGQLTSSTNDAIEPVPWTSDWTAVQNFQQSESTWIAFSQDTVEQEIACGDQWWPSTVEKPNPSRSPHHDGSSVFLEAFPSEKLSCEDPAYIPTLQQFLQGPAEKDNTEEHREQSLLDGLQDLDRMIGVKYKRAESLSCKLLLQSLHLERPSSEHVTVQLKTNARFSPNLPTSNQQLAANAKRRLSYDFNRNIMT